MQGAGVGERECNRELGAHDEEDKDGFNRLAPRSWDQFVLQLSSRASATSMGPVSMKWRSLHTAELKLSTPAWPEGRPPRTCPDRKRILSIVSRQLLLVAEQRKAADETLEELSCCCCRSPLSAISHSLLVSGCQIGSNPRGPQDARRPRRTEPSRRRAVIYFVHYLI